MKKKILYTLVISLFVLIFCNESVLAIECPPGQELSPFGNVCIPSSNIPQNVPDFSSSEPSNQSSLFLSSNSKQPTSGFLNAASCTISGNDTLRDLIMNFVVGCIFTRVGYLLIAFAVVIFLWGVFQFIRAGGDEKTQAGKEFMFWGIVGLFVMVSVWGIVAILQNTFSF